jgi:hypothetical protein
MPGVHFYGDSAAGTKFLEAVANLPQTAFIFSTAPNCLHYLAVLGRIFHRQTAA